MRDKDHSRVVLRIEQYGSSTGCDQTYFSLSAILQFASDGLNQRTDHPAKPDQTPDLHRFRRALANRAAQSKIGSERGKQGRLFMEGAPQTIDARGDDPPLIALRLGDDIQGDRRAHIDHDRRSPVKDLHGDGVCQAVLADLAGHRVGDLDPQIGFVSQLKGGYSRQENSGETDQVPGSLRYDRTESQPLDPVFCEIRGRDQINQGVGLCPEFGGRHGIGALYPIGAHDPEMGIGVSDIDCENGHGLWKLSSAGLVQSGITGEKGKDGAIFEFKPQGTL